MNLDFLKFFSMNQWIHVVYHIRTRMGPQKKLEFQKKKRHLIRGPKIFCYGTYACLLHKRHSTLFTLQHGFGNLVLNPDSASLEIRRLYMESLLHSPFLGNGKFSLAPRYDSQKALSNSKKI